MVPADFFAEPIAALATPPGRGDWALIRISGEQCWQRLLSLLPASIRFRPSLLLPTEICWQAGSESVPCWLVSYRQGASYTGEQSVELFVPGSPPLIRELLETLRLAGIAAAQAGEFTRRAFLSGRIDLTQAESVQQLIAAESQQEIEAARRMLGGALATEISQIGEQLHSMIALTEAGLDFSDQEVDPPSADSLLLQLTPVRQGISRLLRNPRLLVRGGERLRIVIWGRANAGKSTLVNALCGRAAAITSSQPGTTRDPVTVEVSKDDLPTLEFIDLPGERPEAGALEREAVEIGRELIRSAELLIHLEDGCRERAPRDREFAQAQAILSELRMPLERLWRVDSKSDRAGFKSSPEAKFSISGLKEPAVAPLWQAIAGFVSSGKVSTGSVLSMTQRQFGLLQECDELLAEIEAELRISVQPDLLAANLRAAYEPLQEVTGILNTEEILDKIFAMFCLGK